MHIYVVAPTRLLDLVVGRIFITERAVSCGTFWCFRHDCRATSVQCHVGLVYRACGNQLPDLLIGPSRLQQLWEGLHQVGQRAGRDRGERKGGIDEPVAAFRLG